MRIHNDKVSLGHHIEAMITAFESEYKSHVIQSIYINRIQSMGNLRGRPIVEVTIEVA